MYIGRLRESLDRKNLEDGGEDGGEDEAEGGSQHVAGVALGLGLGLVVGSGLLGLGVGVGEGDSDQEGEEECNEDLVHLEDVGGECLEMKRQ